jgi:hypothetical protein
VKKTGSRVRQPMSLDSSAAIHALRGDVLSRVCCAPLRPQPANEPTSVRPTVSPGSLHAQLGRKLVNRLHRLSAIMSAGAPCGWCRVLSSLLEMTIKCSCEEGKICFGSRLFPYTLIESACYSAQHPNHYWNHTNGDVQSVAAEARCGVASPRSVDPTMPMVRAFSQPL